MSDFEGFDMWDPRYQCDVCRRVTPFEQLHALQDVPAGQHNLDTFYGVHAGMIGEEVRAGDSNAEWLFGIPPGLGCAYCVTSMNLHATTWDLSDVVTHGPAYIGMAAVRIRRDATYEDVAAHLPNLTAGDPVYQWVFGDPSAWTPLHPGEPVHEMTGFGLFNTEPRRAA